MDSFQRVKKIAISGKIASGKTTVANHLRDNHGFEQIRSAEYLKFICKEMASYNEAMYVNGDHKAAGVALSMIDTYIGFISDKLDDNQEAKLRILIYDLMRRHYNVYDTSSKSDDVRGMLQVVANEILNSTIKTIWVDSAIKQMNRRERNGDDIRFVHDDMRYDFEFEALRKAGFTLIRLDISKEVQAERVRLLYGDINPNKLTHISETALDDFRFDHHLNADKPLIEMLAEINKIVEGK